MILRSVTKHVKDQNWFAVFIDLLIVILGVFIGIQVANWNQSQKDQLNVKEYIVRIQSDLQANIKDMNRRIEYFNSVRNHGLIALKALDEPLDNLDQQFLIGAYQVSQSLPRHLGRDAYDELLSVGTINHIGDKLIRGRLAQYYRSLKTSETFFIHEPAYRNILRSHMPYEAQAVFRGDCANQFFSDELGAPVLVLAKNCDMGLTDEKVKTAIIALKAANLKGPLTRVLVDIDLKLQIFAVVIDRAQTLNKFLEEHKL